MGKNKLILIFFIVLFYELSFSQSKYIDNSFIVLKNNDTISGYIKANSLSIFSRILFKKNLLDKFNMYEPKDVKSFVFHKKEYESIYLTKSITGISHYIFAEKLESGKITLYKSKYRYFSCACEPEGSIGEGFIAIRNDSIFILSKKFISSKLKEPEILLELINNEIFSNDNNLIELDYNSIPQIIKKYNLQF